MVGQLGGDLPELRQHRLHQGRVEGVGDLEPGGALEVRRHLRDGLRGTGDDHGPRAVDSGDVHTVDEVLADVLFCGLYGDHRAAVRQRLHEPGAGGHEGCRVFQGQHPGHMGSAQFADGVPGHHVGAHTPRLQQSVESNLVGEEGRLREPCPVQALAVPHHLTKGKPKRLDHLVQRLREDRERVVQLTPHPGTLAALSGEHERRPALHRRPTGDDRGESAQQFLAVPAHHDSPVLEHTPRRGQRERHVQRRQILSPGQIPGQPLRLRPQRTLTTSRQHPRNDRQRRRSFLFCLFLNRSFFQDDVRVGPADAEGRDSRPAGPPVALPFPGLGE